MENMENWSDENNYGTNAFGVGINTQMLTL